MNKPIKTPQSTPIRRLGLSRSIKKKTPINQSKNTAVNSNSVERTPCSLLQEKLQITSTANSPSTPIAKENYVTAEPVLNETPVIPKPSQSTGNKFRYRLSLNKSNRENFTKKRLDFIAPTASTSSVTSDTCTSDDASSANQNSDSSIQIEFVNANALLNNVENLEIPDELFTQWPDDDQQPFDKETDQSIENQCKEIEKELEMKRQRISEYHKHLAKVNQLKSSIILWKNGLQSAIIELQKRIQPPQDTATILRHFNITLDLDKC